MASFRTSGKLYGRLVLVIGAGFIAGCSKERLDFAKLESHRRETSVASTLAAGLKESQKGIDLAVADFDCFGCQTQGWSSWILEQSSLSAYVEKNLQRVLSQPSESLPRRIEATLILWKRTAEVSWLTNLFSLVQRPGPPAVLRGRMLLASLFDFGDVRTNIVLPADQEIRIGFENLRPVIERSIKAGSSHPLQ